MKNNKIDLLVTELDNIEQKALAIQESGKLSENVSFMRFLAWRRQKIQRLLASPIA